MFVFAIIGIVMIGWGSSESKKRIEDRFGELTPTTRDLSEGTGVVPPWISWVVILGWIGLVVGIVGGLVQISG